MRTHTSAAPLLLVGIVAIAALSGIDAMMNAATTYVPSNGDGSNECQRVLNGVLVDIACNDDFCLNPENTCYLKNRSSGSSSSYSYGWSSSRSSFVSSFYSSFYSSFRSSSSSRISSWYSSAKSSADDDDDEKSCVRRNFECRDGETGPTCFKRMRSRAVECTDSACIGFTCVARDMFLTTIGFADWDLGDLPGPFPRTETMCMLKKSDCAPTDASCFSDVTFEQVACDDSRCWAPDACDRLTVQVDNNDRIVSGSTQRSSSSRSSESGNSGPGSRSSSSFGLVPPFNSSSSSIGIMLGCFADDGTWTTERARCAADQSRFIATKSSAGTAGTPIVTEPEIRRVIERTFVPPSERDQLRDTLVNTIDVALDRLTRLLDANVLSESVRVQTVSTVEWLRGTRNAFDGADRTIDEINRASREVRARIDGTQQAIDADMANLPKRDPNDLLSKTDKIFAILPDAFSIMQQNGVILTSEMLNHYLAAKNAYDVVKPLCETDADKCLRLNEVVDPLQKLVDTMKAAIDAAGRQDVADQIDQLFQR